MIKVIKEGKKSFITTCPKCGCEFVYELADIIVSSVHCPFCGELIIHKRQAGDEHNEHKRFIDNIVLTTNTSEE